MLPGALVVPACASGVIGTFLLLVSVASLPGAQGWQALLPLPRSLVLQALLPWEEGEGEGGARVAGASVMSGIVGFVGATAVDKKGGKSHEHVHHWRDRAPLPLLLHSLWPQTSLWPRGWNCVLPTLMLLCSLEQQVQTPQLRIWDCSITGSPVPWFYFLYVFQSTHL